MVMTQPLARGEVCGVERSEMLGERDSFWESRSPAAGVAVRGLWLWIRVGAVMGVQLCCTGLAVVEEP